MAGSGAEVLDGRALNRALLARQLLLRRAPLSAHHAVEHLVGLQAQAPLPPYQGLWSRLDGFDPNELGRLLTDREAVRLTLMRGTVHLVTAADALLLRPLVQPAIARSFNGAFGRRLGGVDLAELPSAVRELLAAEPLTARELGRRLAERGFGDDAEALGNAARAHVPLVQVPPRGVWGARGQARYATLESWTGRAPPAEAPVDEAVVRYLRAFGPASVADAQAWSGLTRLAAAFERLRPRLLAFRDDRGRELFDVPDGERPDAAVPAPVRFLGEFDNVLLGHADRRRIVPEGFSWQAVAPGGRAVSSVLVGGMLRGVWWLERDRTRCASLVVRPFRPLSPPEREEAAAEAARMLDFTAADAGARAVRIERAVAGR